MKPNEAIRIGCKLYPHKVKNRFFHVPGNGACVNGAAVAGFWSKNSTSIGFVDATLKTLYGVDAMSFAAQELNDCTDLTREEIADMLERWGL